MVRALARVFAGLTALLILAGGAVACVLTLYQTPGPLAEAVIVEIPRGAGLSEIADRLQEAGVVDDRWVFIAGTLVSRRDRGLKAGEYEFPAGGSAADAATILNRGITVAYSLTVPEGRTSAEIVALVTAEPLLSGPPATVPPEGSLLPETYRFRRGDTRAALLERMQAAMRETLDTLWPAREKGLPLRTPEEAVTLASIVEEETGVAAERATVASVFVNRLRVGMPLQSDPTVIFALTGGKAPLGRDLLRADWQVASPYNTYAQAGLPPGPIANPGRAAIEAVLHPAVTGFFYFVADGSGGHAFARTLEEHNHNVAKAQRVRPAADARDEAPADAAP